MRKFFKSVLFICLFVSIAVCSTACGNIKISVNSTPKVSTGDSSVFSSNTSSQSSKYYSSDSSNQSSRFFSSSDSKTSGLGIFSSLEDYLDSDMVRNSINSVEESMEDAGIEVEVKAEGSKLVYEYKYDIKIDANVVKSSLDKALESSSSTFEYIAKATKAVVDDDNITVVVRYLNSDGSVITEREFKAK